MSNRIVRKVSKKTLGKSVDTVADYVDLLSHMVAEYFNTRYKISKRVDEVRESTLKGLYALKAGFIKSVVEAIFLTTGLLALVVGVIIVVSKVAPLEYVLIVYGLLAMIIVLLRMKLKL